MRWCARCLFVKNRHRKHKRHARCVIDHEPPLGNWNWAVFMIMMMRQYVATFQTVPDLLSLVNIKGAHMDPLLNLERNFIMMVVRFSIAVSVKTTRSTLM